MGRGRNVTTGDGGKESARNDAGVASVGGVATDTGVEGDDGIEEAEAGGGGRGDEEEMLESEGNWNPLDGIDCVATEPTGGVDGSSDCWGTALICRGELTPW